MRASGKKINKTLKNRIEKTFVQVVADFRDTKKTEAFLKGFMTDSEFEGFARRLAIAYWLRKGRSYENIKENLKVSSATIANVAEMMKKDGFESAIKSIEADEWANQWSEKIRKFVGK